MLMYSQNDSAENFRRFNNYNCKEHSVMIDSN